MDLTAPFVRHRSPSIHLVIEVTGVLANWLYGGNSGTRDFSYLYGRK